MRQAYIPPITGKEKRKATAGKEGLLGVEGMDNAVIIDALARAGAIFEDEDAPAAVKMALTKGDLYALGLSGHPDSATKRQALLARLGLPTNLSANRLIDILNATVTADEFAAHLHAIETK